MKQYCFKLIFFVCLFKFSVVLDCQRTTEHNHERHPIRVGQVLHEAPLVSTDIVTSRMQKKPVFIYHR